MNKICTSLEQSKKLAEILPIESADMWWNFYSVTTNDTTPQIIHLDTPWVGSFNWDNKPDNIPCWSLTALLDILPSGTELLKLFEYSYHCQSDMCDTLELNPIDACVEMLIELHEQKLL